MNEQQFQQQQANDAKQRYERELQLAQQQQTPQVASYSTSMFSNQPKQNLIELELEFKSELEDIERLLRCDVLVRDSKGNEYWASNPDKDVIFFNELGVNDILRNIIAVVNKGKALSNYDADEINARVRQFKHELRVLIYNNYERYGMDNEYKQNNYSFVVLSVGSIIEDVYRRAMNGETHRGLNEQRIVTQNDNLGGQQSQGVVQMSQNKGAGWQKVLPWEWGKK